MARTSSMLCIDRRRTILGAVCLMVAGVLSGGCRQAPPPAARVQRIEADAAGLTIEFDRAAALERIEIVDDNGDVVLTCPMAAGRRVYHAPFRWIAESQYDVRLQLAGRTLRETVRTPAQTAALRAFVELPLGQQTWELGTAPTAGVLLPGDGEVLIGLKIECTRQRRTDYRLEVQLPPGVSVVSEDQRLDIRDRELTLAGTLEIESDYVLVVARLKSTAATAGAMTVDFASWAEADGTTRQSPGVEHRLTVDLRRAEISELASWLECGESRFPVDESGQAEAERLADTVVLPNVVWSTVRRWARPSDRLFSFHEPYGLHSLELTNRARWPLNLIVRSEVVGAADETALLDFAPPRWLAPRESPTTDHLVRLDPGETATVTMPLYVRPEVRPGSYRRRLRVYMVGSQQPLAVVHRPLEVVRGDPIVSVVVIVAIGAALAAWVFMAFGGRRFLSRIGTEGLTRVGMIASLHFVVSYVARIGGDIIAGVTGPFYIFITGIANEGIACLLLAVLVTLVPRVGVLTMSSLTVFVLNAMFTGQFGLVDLLFVTVSILWGEFTLAALGVTTGGRPLRPRSTAPLGTVLRVALAIGLANAATLYVQYCLIQALHRLFFADWYVTAVALVTGLLYGGLGAAAGTVLGFQLRRTVP